MPKKHGKKKSPPSARHSRQSEGKQHLCRWMQQQGLKQEVVTLQQPYIVSQPLYAATTPAYSNTLFANCNGFNVYTAAGALQTDLLPQTGIWDTYAKIYRYYLIEEIMVEWIPVRQQIALTDAGAATEVWQMPTYINTFPSQDGATIFPQTTVAGVNKALVDLCARRKPHIVEGNKRCKFSLGVEENLVSRQDYPMLLTFGSSTTREKYQGPRASTVTAIVSNALNKNLPMGIAQVTMRTRFAGLVRPQQAGAIDELSQHIQTSRSAMPQPTGRAALCSDFVQETVPSKEKKKKKKVRDPSSSSSHSLQSSTRDFPQERRQ